jgi:hypothetical protein
MPLHIHRRLVHLSIVIGVLAGLIATPATSGLAGSLHATLKVVPLPPALTLSDTTTRFGLIKVVFATQNSSANHITVTITTTPAVTLVSAALPSNCPLPGSGMTPVTCTLTNTGPNTTATPILIEFQSPTACPADCSIEVNGTVTFSQGSLSSTESIGATPQNFQLFASTQKASADGDCPTFSAGTKTLGTTVSSTVPQAAQVSFGPAANGPPCTPAAAGAQNFPNVHPKPTNSPLLLDQIWFVELTKLSGTGLATATLQVANLPSGTNKNNFHLQEFTNDLYSGSFDPAKFSAVQPCFNGAPPSGADSCISDISNLPGGGLSITLILLPAAGDGSYSG